MSAELLRATGLGWRWDRRQPWLFRDLDVVLHAGDALRVTGGNGSGKSTLLRVLAGTARPRAGTVRRAARVAALPQTTDDLPAVPAGAVHRALAGADSEDPRVQAHAHLPCDALSGGTVRRLLLSALLAQPTPLLVLDEPSPGLDDAAERDLVRRLEEHRARGGAVVLADHGGLRLQDQRELALGGAAARPGVRVVLAGEGGLRGQPAVAGLLTLTVGPEDVDALLREALQGGWSVRRVEP